jgi:hypothetical protein
MKTKHIIPTLSAAIFLFAAAHLHAQQSGVSNPDALHDTITDPPAETPLPPPSHYVKPSAGIPMQAAPSQPAQLPAVDEYTPTQEPSPALHARDPEPHAVEAEPIQTAQLHREYPTREDPGIDRSLLATDDDPTSGIVMEVPSGPDELPLGTLLHASLLQTISTRETAVESRFTARLTADVLKHGRVMLPAGTIISGRITQIHGGHRAAIRLQPDIVKLPGGMTYELEAEVIDLESGQGSHVNSEGSIIGNTATKQTAATFGATTFGGALIGGVTGGPVGAVVGAGIGAGVGTVIWFRTDHQETLSSGTGLIFSLNRNLQLQPPTH